MATLQLRARREEPGVSAVEIPQLEGDARAAAEYRGGHLQIIASAGSGKTEVVSQRVAALLAEGVDPEGIVAFTFTERAAASLKSRIDRCVLASPELGQPFLDHLGPMFVGTIHSYCFDVLQRHVPKYETYDVLDDHRLTAFGEDECALYALVQLLTQAAYAVTPSQRERLVLFGSRADFVLREAVPERPAPRIDLYVLLVKPPNNRTHKRLLERAIRLSKALMREDAFKSRIRRIAWINCSEASERSLRLCEVTIASLDAPDSTGPMAAEDDQAGSSSPETARAYYIFGPTQPGSRYARLADDFLEARRTTRFREGVPD
jgi:hypothetical protein